MTLFEKVRENLARRPWWMNIMYLFCLYMAFIYMPWDIFVKPMAVDEEVWFGYQFTGFWAKATAPLHWLIYAAGAYGFWHMKRWMHPWAAIYMVQIVIAMTVFPILYRDTIVGGLLVGAVWVIPTVALWRARERFQG